MANIDGIITEDIRNTIAPGQTVYDFEGKRVGSVDLVYHDTGYFVIEPAPFIDRERPFSDQDLYVPFRLITNIDPGELYLAVTRDDLLRNYTSPPPRATFVEDESGREVATTTEPSGFTGTPLVVERVRIDQLKRRIAIGDHVFTSELTDLGVIKKYDPVTGWMLVEKGILSDKHDLMVPVTVVEDVDRDTHEVYLVTSRADLQQLQHLEPAYVVFPEATTDDRS